MLKIKRAYQKSDESDGFRVLVDRFWPRGISKSEAQINLWLKEISPSSNLRIWFNHDPNKWLEFQKRYVQELQENQEVVEQLKKIIKIHQNITLVYAAKDELHNEAVVLLDYLQAKSTDSA